MPLHSQDWVVNPHFKLVFVWAEIKSELNKRVIEKPETNAIYTIKKTFKQTHESEQGFVYRVRIIFHTESHASSKLECVFIDFGKLTTRL